MRKFWVLLRKELKELLTPQVLIPMAATMLLLAVIGKVASRERSSSSEGRHPVLVDLDQTASSRAAVEVLRKKDPTLATLRALSEAEAVAMAELSGKGVLLVIPKDFSASLRRKASPEIGVYTFLSGFSLPAAIKALGSGQAFLVLNQAVSHRLIALGGAADPEFVRKPLSAREYVVVQGRQAKISMPQLINVVQSQALFVPVVMVMIIVIAAQMVATTVANEKENKTFETLLSLPIERDTIVYAKLGAAALVALLFAGCYMIGFRFYLADITGELMTGGSSGEMAAALTSLGVTMSLGSTMLLGTSLFLGILCALSIAMILGLLADDVKGVQVVTMPLILLVLIPYMLTMMTEINAASWGLRAVILAIPFSHPFLASAHLMTGETYPVICGIVYQAIVFFFFVALAGRIFSSDAVISFRPWGSKN